MVTVFVLEQRRFFADGAADTTKWPVPLYASVDGTQQSISVMASQRDGALSRREKCEVGQIERGPARLYE